MYKDILLAVDLVNDESWKNSVPTVVEYAKAFGSTVHVVTVVPDFGMTIVASYFQKDHQEKAIEDCRGQLHARKLPRRHKSPAHRRVRGGIRGNPRI